MAEQFTATNGAAPARRLEVDRARDQLLAGAALAAEQNGGVVVHHPPDKLIDLLHGRAAADDLAADQLAAHLILQRREIGGLGRHFDRTRDGRRYQVEVFERLGEVVVRTALHRLNRIVHRAGGGNHNDQGAAGLLAGAGEHLQAANSGHHDVEQGDFVAIAEERFERALAVGGLFDPIAGGFEPMMEDQADARVVVGDQHSGGRGVRSSFEGLIIGIGGHRFLFYYRSVISWSGARYLGRKSEFQPAPTYEPIDCQPRI